MIPEEGKSIHNRLKRSTVVLANKGSCEARREARWKIMPQPGVTVQSSDPWIADQKSNIIKNVTCDGMMNTFSAL